MSDSAQNNRWTDRSLFHLLRPAHTKRWTIVNTRRQQNVAEHSYTVALIAARICKELEWPEDFSVLCEVLRWALMHDMAEIVTGDIPATVKEFIPRDVTDRAMRALDVDEPEDIRILHIVKAADLAEGYAFLWLEQDGGSHGAHAMKLLERAYREHIATAKGETHLPFDRITDLPARLVQYKAIEI